MCDSSWSSCLDFSLTEGIGAENSRHKFATQAIFLEFARTKIRNLISTQICFYRALDQQFHNPKSTSNLTLVFLSLMSSSICLCALAGMVVGPSRVSSCINLKILSRSWVKLAKPKGKRHTNRFLAAYMSGGGNLLSCYQSSCQSCFLRACIWFFEVFQERESKQALAVFYLVL